LNTPRLYDYYRSSAAYRVRIALALKNISVEHIPVNLMPGVDGQHDRKYKAVNSQGRVPTWLEDNFSLGQSMAIVEYLEEIYPGTPLLPPDPQQRARVRQMMSLVACDIHPLNNLSVTNYLKGTFAANAVAINTWYSHWVQTGFAAFEDLIAEGNTYCLGDKPTMADAFLVPQVYNARRFDVPLDEFPKIVSVDAHCSRLDAFAAAAPENQGGQEF
jgi:maleylacetoacetate isomerase